MKWLRNLFLPQKVWFVRCTNESKNVVEVQTRVFLDSETMNRWIGYMEEDGFSVIEQAAVKIIVNNTGD